MKIFSSYKQEEKRKKQEEDFKMWFQNESLFNIRGYTAGLFGMRGYNIGLFGFHIYMHPTSIISIIFFLLMFISQKRIFRFLLCMSHLITRPFYFRDLFQHSSKDLMPKLPYIGIEIISSIIAINYICLYVRESWPSLWRRQEHHVE